MKPRIGVLTTFSNLDTSYSLCSVVQSQLVSLVKYGYPTVLFTHDNFQDDAKVPEGVEIRKVIPRFTLVDYAANQEVDKKAGLQEQADTAYKALEENTKDIDIILEHDLIFQGWFLPYCMAIHRLAEDTKIKWFHWIHSVPNLPPKGLKYPHNLRYELPQNSKLVYLNNYHSVRAAESYQTFPKDVRVVYNPVDPRIFWNVHPLVKHLLDKYDILDSDFIQVYPVSTPRMVDGKGLYTLIDIFAKLKGLHKKVSLIICNAHANAEKDKEIIRQALEYGYTKGLSAGELIFTSLLESEKDSKAYELGVSREVVSQLLHISNLFVFPSHSENCSLILLEAMLSKNLLVLNQSVGAMREFGKENALYFKFGGIDENVEYDNREGFMEDVAKIINSEMENNKPLKAATVARRQFNYDTVFRNMVEPLFFES